MTASDDAVPPEGITNPYPGKEQDAQKLRDYGRPGSEPIGIPVAKPLDASYNAECPNCGCRQVMEITVRAKQPFLRGGVGTGKYLGCPACPWASPMALASDAVRVTEEDKA